MFTFAFYHRLIALRRLGNLPRAHEEPTFACVVRTYPSRMVEQDSQNSDARLERLRRCFPELDDAELERAAENLKRYAELVLRVVDRRARESREDCSMADE